MTNRSEDEPKKKKKTREIKLKRGKHGYLILPSLEDINGYELQCKKQLIGRFITDIYSL